MKNRNQIEEKYKWDLSSYIESEEEIEKILKKLEKMPEKYLKYKGNLGNRDIFIDYIKNSNQDYQLLSKLTVYLACSLDVNCSDVKMLKYAQRFDTLAQKFNEATAFITPQMYELDDEYLKSLLTEKKLKNCDNMIKDILRKKPHRLDEKTSELLSKMGTFLSPGSSTHASILNELKFESIRDKKGKIIKLDNSNLHKYIEGKDRELRKAAYFSRQNAYKDFNKTFAQIYTNDVQESKFNTRLARHSSVLEWELFDSEIPQAVFDNNIKMVNKYLPLLHEYVRLAKVESGLKDFAYFDLLLDKSVSKRISVEEAQQTILKALKPLGEEYLSRVKNKLSDRSIDYMPNKDKRTGGYCSNCYDNKTIILMNFTNDYDSMTTLIHEMGHCINAEYFNEAQPYEKAEITIFAAEIASTVNEILLNLYMQKQAKTRKEKLQYVWQLLDTIKGTIYRQTQFSEFELFVHERIESDEPITFEDLNNKYLELTKKYYGKYVKIPDVEKYEWSRVPHFYSPFYVFTYSTGMITAITIATRLLEDETFKDKYIKFLSNGTNKPAVDALKEIDIDLTQEKPFVDAFNFIREQINELKA